jgi:anti-sigma factor RsiW
MGMNTPHPGRDLLALVERRLDHAARAQVEQHLATCATCRAEAADLMEMADTLGALPSALGPLSTRPAGSWSHVWARVQGVPIRRVAPQLNLYVSLAAVLFVLAAALPAGLAAQPLPVTAGVIQTPVVEQATPLAGTATAAGSGQLGTALAGDRHGTPARPIAIETPIPGQKG